MTGPLSGVRVLDLTTMVSGPIATMLLADQGAEVIKVEAPGGDYMRRVGVKHRGMSTSFLTCNRGKRSLCLDIKRPEGLEIVKQLASTVDVFVQNFRPGAIQRMGLSRETVSDIRPDIIYTSISGFGDTGPCSHQRVYDPVIQALSGMADVQMDQHSGLPRMVRTIICDKTSALATAQSITAALFRRERTGKGGHVGVAMLDVMIGFLWPEAMASLSFIGKEEDPAHSQRSPDLVFKSQDGYLTAGAISDLEWEGMCRALDRTDLIEDPRFKTAAERAHNSAERRQITSDEISNWPSAELLARFDTEGVAAAPILNRTGIMDHPQVIENRIFQPIEDGVLGPVRMPRPATIFDDQATSISTLAPFKGDDNTAILTEIGYQPEQITQLKNANVLFDSPPTTDQGSRS